MSMDASLAMMNRCHLKNYSPMLEYTLHQQHFIPPTMCIIHFKDSINKPLFSTSPTKYRKCKHLDSSSMH
jgi:hypothetical protein